MDSQINSQGTPTLNQTPPLAFPQTSKKKLFPIIIAVGILILVGEVIWAYMNFQQNQPASTQSQVTENVSTASSLPDKPKNGSISLTAPKNSIKVGEKLTVTINASSSGRLTDGTDVIITYDPKLLFVETIGEDKKPIVVNNIYNEFPNNSLDATNGIITASGIASEQNGVGINGVFGSMIFTGKAPGKATITIQFDPNLTSESNIIETKSGVDILNQVQNLEVEIK